MQTTRVISGHKILLDNNITPEYIFKSNKKGTFKITSASNSLNSIETNPITFNGTSQSHNVDFFIFDGSNHFEISSSIVPDLTFTNFTIDFWVSFQDTNLKNYIFSQGDGNNYNNIDIYFEAKYI